MSLHHGTYITSPTFGLHLFFNQRIEGDMSRSPFNFTFLITPNNSILHIDKLLKTVNLAIATMISVWSLGDLVH